MRKLWDFWEAATAFLGIAIMVFGAVYPLYADGVWSFHVTILIGFVIFVIFGVAAFIKERRKTADAERRYEQIKAANPPATNQTVTADRGGIARNYSPDTNSHNTTNIGAVQIGQDRTKKDLILQIGIDLQVFSRAFYDVVHASPRDLHEIHAKAGRVFEKITSDLFYQANLLLTDTPIPKNLVELNYYFEEYSQNLFIHHSVEKEIHGYIIKGKSMARKKSRIPAELDERERELSIAIDRGQFMVQYIVADILKLCKE